ncbi:NIL domain-containing protein [Chloroflexota bacterium]
MAVSRKVVLHFPRRLVDQPIICRLVKDFNLEFNILKASVTPEEEGLLVMELAGEKGDYDEGLQYLSRAGVQVQLLAQHVSRNEDRCTHCGACVAFCPSGAFIIDDVSRWVEFWGDKCIACGLCIKACPPRAMEIRF